MLHTSSFKKFEQFLYIKYELFNLQIVKNSKKNKKVLQKDENFQISKHQFSLSIGQRDYFDIFNNIYI